MSLRGVWERLRWPVETATAGDLAAAGARVPSAFSGPRQLLGRHEEGCGATIGVMPRCDFACRGCYLTETANRVPPAPLADVFSQLDHLRAHLGVWGNAQLTDGEVTLRSPDDLVAILRYARRIRLMPMLMTHGDAFRRRPGLLEHLVSRGGLEEISLHVDVTQRGRLGPQYRRAASEAELMPLRDELAELVRSTRRATGRPLRVASTVTVTRQNLGEVGDVVRWALDNADAIRAVSFQPVAPVGRTAPSLEPVSRAALWREIARGLTGDPGTAGDIGDAQWWLGHPSCSRIVMGAALSEPDHPTRFLPLSPTDPDDRRVTNALFDRFAGITFRADRPPERLARLAGMALRAPSLVVREIPRFAWRRLRRAAGGRPARLALRLAAGRARLDRFMVVSHHFMSASELDTEEGRERLASCAFVVPIAGRMVPMCEVNATGARERVYRQLASREALPPAPADPP